MFKANKAKTSKMKRVLLALGCAMGTMAGAIAPDGTNPIIKDRFTPDPAAVADGDWLYVFTGHDEPDARGYKMKNWQVFGTTNLVDWVDWGAVMDTSTFKWAHQGNRAWASEAVKRDGKWYWYVAVAGEGPYRGDCIGVAVADRVEGPWRDPIARPLVGPGRGYIDPSVMVDDDGRAYLFWGNCGGKPGCWYAELTREMTALASPVKPVPGLMDEAAFGKPLKKKRGAGAYKPIDTNFEEAPWIYKAGDTYYLEYAAGGVPEHWAYSTAKSIHGPWTYRGRILDEPFNTGTIHGGSVCWKGNWYMVYHNAALPNGADARRSFCIERYTRRADGSIPFIHQTKAGVSSTPLVPPTLWADVPDIAICRKGKKYYMVSTTMHMNPGIPVMVSTNLVDWTMARSCYRTIENRAKDRLENGENDYSFGTWASSIRYNPDDDYFYVTSFNRHVDATYLFRTKDPEEGEWQFFRLHPQQYDESIWIENGRFWIYATVPGRPYRVRLTEIKPDFSGFVDGGEIVLPEVADVCGGGFGEGSQVFKRDGWYYLVNITWPRGSCRTVVVHRSRTMKGPWEGKVVFSFQGIAQGSFIDDEKGNWYGYFFGDRGGVGRCPYVMPVTWQDGWPVVEKKFFHRAAGSMPGVVKSDDFDSPTLDRVWQWNHNPLDELWSLSARPGWLRLTTDRTAPVITAACNTVTQRCWGPACRAETCLDFAGLKPGDVAGLTLFQAEWGYVGIAMEEAGPVLVRRALREREVRVPVPAGLARVYLRATGDFSPLPNPSFSGIPRSADKGRFFFSFDNQAWFPVGGEMRLPYSMPHFMGYRFGLFCYSTTTPGGQADFDYLHLK